jgi:hypothetical protein
VEQSQSILPVQFVDYIASNSIAFRRPLWQLFHAPNVIGQTAGHRLRFPSQRFMPVGDVVDGDEDLGLDDTRRERKPPFRIHKRQSASISG